MEISERGKKLETLFDSVLEDIIAKIKSGEATPSDRNVARQLLKDNNITSEPTQGSGLSILDDTITEEDIRFDDAKEA